MRTFKEVDQEIGQWRGAIIAYNQESAKIQADQAKLKPSGGLLFSNIDKHNELGRQVRRLESKIQSAQNEITRLQGEWASVAAHVARLGENLAGYEKQLKPGGVDWSKVDLSVDRDAYHEELRGKVAKLETELKTYG